MAAAAVGLPPTAMATPNSTDNSRTELPRPYKCPLCDKAFHRLEHQTRHIRTHTGEKPHACNFAGCSKRFSRSDELTRHSRIHSNPNSRRGRINQTVTNSAAVAAVANGSLLPDGHAMANVMAPPTMSWSNPGSNVSSPNVSPPQPYRLYGSSGHRSPYASYDVSAGHSPEFTSYHSHNPVNMNLLATAASQAAREHELSSVPVTRRPPLSSLPVHQYPHSQSQYKEHTSSSVPRLPSLAAYHYAQPMSRSLSTDTDNHFSSRMIKRSHPGSPFSSAPPSPTFSGVSCSPPLGQTPAMTPGQSPRLPPLDGQLENHLPGIRNLSLQHMQTPLLEPLEPSTEASGGFPANHNHSPYSRSRNSSNSGLRISDIVNREDGAQRKLPMPAPRGVGATELQSLTRSGSSGRLDASGDVDRMERS